MVGYNFQLDDWVLCRLYNKKNSWEKIKKQKEEFSFGETTSSFEASDSLESDVEHDSFQEMDELAQSEAGVYHPGKSSDGLQQFGTVEQKMKEESDWFTDLNLDDLQGDAIGSLPSVPSLYLSNQDYYHLQWISNQLICF